MEPTTAAAIGTVIGSAIASFIAQFWGNRKAEKVGAKVSSSTAAQTTVDEIRDRVIALEGKVDVLVKQPGVVQPKDDRSPERKD